MSGLEDSQCGTSYAFVSWIIKDSMIVVEQYSQPYSQNNRPQSGHSGLSAKPLNAKQLRSDRGNGISIAANRFGCCTEAWCSVPTPVLTWAQSVPGHISLRPSSASRKFFRLCFNSLREQTLRLRGHYNDCWKLKLLFKVGLLRRTWELTQQYFTCGEAVTPTHLALHAG